jgi:hypothetical protein
VIGLTGGNMSKEFTGSVLLPGENGPGLDAALQVDDDVVKLMVGTEELGEWRQRDFDVQPSGKGAFRVALAGEALFFTPSSPASFAEAMAVPLQPEQTKASKSDDDKPKYDIDAAIDELIAQVKPLKSINDEDDILSAPLLTTIMVVAGALMIGLVGMVFML